MQDCTAVINERIIKIKEIELSQEIQKSVCDFNENIVECEEICENAV